MSNAVSVSQLVSDTGDMVVSSIRNVKGTFNGGGSTSVQKNSDTITTLSRTVQPSSRWQVSDARFLSASSDSRNWRYCQTYALPN